MFQRDDWTLFRNLATLGQKAGVPRHRLAALALKELADNALDAGALCTVEALGAGWYAVTDDGEGIDGTDEQIAAAPKELEGKTEQDAVIAYLQGMGRALK